MINTANSLIKIENLTKVFRDPLTLKKKEAVQDLSVNIEAGEVFGYLGPNGAGKTTTFKLLLGLLAPSQGHIYLWGKSHLQIDLKSRIGFLPENPYFYGHLKAKEHLHFFGQLFSLDRRERIKRIDSLMELVGLKDRENELIKTYSKGLLQRFGLAQTLINNPDLLILDEPMSGLDPMGRKEVRDIILRLKEKGKTIIFSTHILSDVETVCDRVGILLNGQLRDCGPLEKLLTPKIQSFEICIDSLSQETITLLGQRDIPVIQRGTETFFTVDSKEAYDLLSFLLSQGGKLLSFSPHKEKFEEIYVSKLLSNEQKLKQ